MSTQNILEIFNSASKNEFVNGQRWYRKARSICKSIAISHRVKLEIVAAILSALSPRNRWENNIEDTMRLIEAERENNVHNLKVRTFNKNKDKALVILRDGNIEIVQKSNKTRCFLDNILNDNSDLVTVDSHAMGVYYNMRIKGKSISDSEYKIISNSYREAAKIVSLKPYQVQAITWLTYKRLYNI